MNQDACDMALKFLDKSHDEARWRAAHAGLTALLLSIQLVTAEDFEN